MVLTSELKQKLSHERGELETNCRNPISNMERRKLNQVFQEDYHIKRFTETFRRHHKYPPHVNCKFNISHMV